MFDLILHAIPVFGVCLALEAASFHFRPDDDELGYELRDSRTSLAMGVGHVVHHSSRYYNLSTALRQPWTPFTSMPFWLPLALLGFSPSMILFQQSVSLVHQFFIHTESRNAVVAGGAGDEHAVAPPGAPRLERGVPRPQLRRHPDRLGPAVPHLRTRARAGRLRADHEPRDLQPGPGRDPRVH